MIEHPGIDLVGVWVHSPDKAGRDAGDLCGLAATGVAATNDIEDVVALGADCVLYMPRELDADEVCRLLAAGSNVVTTRGEFHHPPSMDPALRERVEAACAEGGTSIHSTGSSPGFITEAVPLVLSSIQRRLDRLTIDEFADLSRRALPRPAVRDHGLRPAGGRRSTRPPAARAGQLRPVAAARSPTRSASRSTTSRPAASSRSPAAPSRSRPARSRPAPSPPSG